MNDQGRKGGQCWTALLWAYAVASCGCSEAPRPAGDAVAEARDVDLSEREPPPDATADVMAPEAPPPDAPDDRADTADATDVGGAAALPDASDVRDAPDGTEARDAPDGTDAADVLDVLDARDATDVADGMDVTDVTDAMDARVAPDAPPEVGLDVAPDRGPDAACMRPAGCRGGGFGTGFGSYFGVNPPYRRLALADVTGDGVPDALASGSAVYNLLLATARAPMVWGLGAAVAEGRGGGFVTGEFTGDRFADVVSIDQVSGRTTLHQGSAAGLTSAALPLVPTVRTISTLTAGDVNRDGRDDVVVTGVTTGGSPAVQALLLGSSPRLVELALPAAPAAAVIADVNSDGRPELLLASAAGALVRVDDLAASPRVVPMGSLGARPVDLAVGDVTAAPGLEVVAMTTFGLSVFQRAADGSLGASTELATDVGSEVDCADLDGDGRDEVIAPFDAGRSFWEVRVYRGGDAGVRDVPLTVPVSAAPATLVVRDLNGDRRPDLTLLQNAGGHGWTTALLNRGDGTFDTPDFLSPGVGPTGTGATASAAADLDRDGASELLIARTAAGGIGEVEVLGDDGCGPRTRQRLSLARPPRSLLLADADGDGDPDLVASEQYDIGVFLQEGGRFTSTAISLRGTDIQGVFVADVDGDRRPDVCVMEVGTLRVFRATAPGVFSTTPMMASVGSVSAAGDLDGDGQSELITSGASAFSVMRLVGGAWVRVGGYTHPTPLPFAIHTVRDLNGDGRGDLLGAALDATITFTSRADGTFNGPLLSPVPPTPYVVPFGARPTVGDTNGDGRPDVVWSGPSVRIGLGDGAGRFTPTPNDWSMLSGAGAIHLADVDRDGRVDLFTRDASGGGLVVRRCRP